MFDTVIKNAKIADGTGSPLLSGDIGVIGGKIACIGNLDAADGVRAIDAAGQIVSPGFIDIHSHTDDVVIIEPSCQSKITQGITTEVSGNCGYSSAPILDEGSRTAHDRWRETHGIEDDWTTMGEFLSVLEKRRFATNFVTYLGHANIRTAVVGLDDRAPTPDELVRMQEMTSQAMAEGAWGLSTGLIYAPGCFAGTDEIAALAAATSDYGGIYSSHIRSERDEMVRAVEEAITIGRTAGVPVQIAHHKACGSNNWGLVKETLALIDQANSEGMDVTCDQYPYTASATGLSILVPKWAHDGGRAKLVERLRGEERSRIKAEVRKAAEPGGWVANDGGFQSVVVSGVSKEANKHFEGLNLLEIAELRGLDPVDTLLELLIDEDGSVGMVHFAQCEEDIETVMRHPTAMIGTDATARAQQGPMSRGKPHPRSYGTFPRVLGRYVREKRVIPLELAIRKMTSMPARKLGLTDRGVIREGAWADLVIFDPEAITDKATYKDPHQIAEGISFVLVNGRVSVENGEMTGELAGMVLRKTNKQTRR